MKKNKLVTSYNINYVGQPGEYLGEVEKRVTYDIPIGPMFFLSLIPAFVGFFIGLIIGGLLVGIIGFLSFFLVMIFISIFLSREVKYFAIK